METDVIIYLQKFNTWIICHILCVKRYIYSNNNLFRINLERFIITTEVPTGMSVRPLNHILCCFNSLTNWEFDQMGRGPSEWTTGIIHSTIFKDRVKQNYRIYRFTNILFVC